MFQAPLPRHGALGPGAAIAMQVPSSLRPGIWAVPPRESREDLQHVAFILRYNLCCGSAQALCRAMGSPSVSWKPQKCLAAVCSLLVEVGFVYGEPGVLKILEKRGGISVDRVVSPCSPESSSG